MAVDWLTPLLLGATNVGAGWLEYEKEARKRKEWDEERQWRKDRATEEDRRYKEGLTREAAALARARGDRWVESLYAGTQPAAFVTEAMLKDIAEAGHFDPTHPDFDTPQERLDWARRPMANARLRYLNEVVKAHPDVATDTLMREGYGPYIGKRIVTVPALPATYGNERSVTVPGNVLPGGARRVGVVGQLVDRKVVPVAGPFLPGDLPPVATVFKYRPRTKEASEVVYGPFESTTSGWDLIDIGGKKKWVPADQGVAHEEKRRLEQKAEDEKIPMSYTVLGPDGKSTTKTMKVPYADYIADQREQEKRAYDRINDEADRRNRSDVARIGASSAETRATLGAEARRRDTAIRVQTARYTAIISAANKEETQARLLQKAIQDDPALSEKESTTLLGEVAAKITAAQQRRATAIDDMNTFATQLGNEAGLPVSDLGAGSPARATLLGALAGLGLSGRSEPATGSDEFTVPVLGIGRELGAGASSRPAAAPSPPSRVVLQARPTIVFGPGGNVLLFDEADMQALAHVRRTLPSRNPNSVTPHELASVENARRRRRVPPKLPPVAGPKPQ